MTESKLKRNVILITIASVLIICGLIVGLSIQFIKINTLRAQQQKLNESVEYYNAQNQDLSNKINYAQNQKLLEDMFRALGYSKDGDVVFE